MHSTNPKVPLLFLIFNREDVALEAMKSIREYKPDKLYIAADGPRTSKVGEKEKCDKVRQSVLDMIDWDCEVFTLFRQNNLGCAKAVSGALDWFFENEDFGIIIEDDIILSQDFYRFAAEMNKKYHDEEKVMCVNAIYLGKEKEFNTSYVFSTMGNCWGWATWRRAWQHMDLSMSLFPRTSLKKHIKAFGLLRGIMLYFYYWKHDYKLISSGGDISSWATRWSFNIFANDGLVITPTVNMVINSGFNGQEGTHYSSNDEDLYSFLRLGSLPERISHPDCTLPNRKMRKIESSDFKRIRIKGFFKKLKRHYSD